MKKPQISQDAGVFLCVMVSVELPRLLRNPLVAHPAYPPVHTVETTTHPNRLWREPTVLSAACYYRSLHYSRLNLHGAKTKDLAP